MTARERAIVLADITGYTAYVSSTELEHSHEILGELLRTLTDRMQRTLTVAQIEGDAVFWLGDEVSVTLVERIEEAFTAFHRRLRDIATGSTCPCRACASVGALTVKFIVHRGELTIQSVAGTDHFVGTDVVIAHRLLKNAIPAREYLVVTAAALEALPADARDRFMPHQEAYDHVGVIRVAYRDLDELRSAAWRVELPVDPARAHLRVTKRVELDPERLWDVAAAALPMGVADLTFPVVDELDIRRVDRRSGARGRARGSEWHCYHGSDGEVTFLRLVARERARLVTVHAGGSGRYTATVRLKPATGGTVLDVCFEWDEGPDADTIGHMRRAVERQLAKLERAVAAERIGEPRRSRVTDIDGLPEDSTEQAPNVLTPREREVAALVARGLGNRAIAEQLVIADRTVGAHIEHIMDKLDIRTRSAIAAWAVSTGVAEPVRPRSRRAGARSGILPMWSGGRPT